MMNIMEMMEALMKIEIIILGNLKMGKKMEMDLFLIKIII